MRDVALKEGCVAAPTRRSVVEYIEDVTVDEVVVNERNEEVAAADGMDELIRLRLVTVDIGPHFPEVEGLILEREEEVCVCM